MHYNTELGPIQLHVHKNDVNNFSYNFTFLYTTVRMKSTEGFLLYSPPLPE